LPVVIKEKEQKKISSKEAVCNIQCDDKFVEFQNKQLDREDTIQLKEYKAVAKESDADALDSEDVEYF
jgi:hypothetical protein